MKLDQKIKAYASLDSDDIDLDPKSVDGEVCFIARHENGRFYLGCPYDGYQEDLYVDFNSIVRVLMPYMNLRGVVRMEKDGTYTAMCPEMPGCESTGTNAEAALKRLEEAKHEWVLNNIAENWDQRAASKDHHDAYKTFHGENSVAAPAAQPMDVTVTEEVAVAEVVEAAAVAE